MYEFLRTALWVISGALILLGFFKIIVGYFGAKQEENRVLYDISVQYKNAVNKAKEKLYWKGIKMIFIACVIMLILILS